MKKFINKFLYQYEVNACKTLQEILDNIIIIDDVKFLDDNIFLSFKKLTELPNLTDIIIQGYFDCSHNNLTSLKGSPRVVCGGFYCGFNQLRNLEHAPQYVGMTTYCFGNYLPKGTPDTIVSNDLEYWKTKTTLQTLYGEETGETLYNL